METISIAEVKRLNRDKGESWFGPDETRFFRSKYSRTAQRVGDKAYFITSEQYDAVSPRLYTIRVCDMITGKIDDVGGFQQYKTNKLAKYALDKLLSS